MGPGIAIRVRRKAIVTTDSMLAGLDGDPIGNAAWHGVGRPHPTPDKHTWVQLRTPRATLRPVTPDRRVLGSAWNCHSYRFRAHVT